MSYLTNFKFGMAEGDENEAIGRTIRMLELHYGTGIYLEGKGRG